jgi:methylmalonyl-CoA/ethylmalonyl-CoA epimerase
MHTELYERPDIFDKTGISIRRVDMAEKKVASSWDLKQIGLVVKDMEKAVERLSILGFGPFNVKTLPDGVKEWVKGKAGRADARVMATDVGNVELELCQPGPGDSSHRDYLESKGEGIQHVMFDADDLEAEVERLGGLGCTILLRAKFGEGAASGGLAYIDLDASGLIVELRQRPKTDPSGGK